ncbi:MFS transporter [Saccharopolyspora hordei]|uniref:MFS family permease n=1 Tax=Saccharopolyspora hordei TaxID=1838 RepID=A0A853AJK0_9PSEU|nr:MFS transporter [Saccharopolyspora hordei]NYI84285.1 MFS family permease [Saccharopolyspora hordei]
MPKNAAQPVVRPPAELNGVIFRKLLPLLIGAYVISFLDRTNIGIAKEQLQVDLGISATAYGIGAGLFFITYSLAEIPSNLVLHRVGARFWITRIMIIWGLVSAGMAFVQGEWSFYIMRMLLGAAEAGLFPGVMYYLTQWFTRADRAKANGLFLLGVSAANILGPPLGGLLLGLGGLGGMHGWQWMFLVEGLPACLLAFVVWKKLPDRPEQARFLTAAEAEDLQRRIAAEDEAGAEASGTHSMRQVWRDPQILLVVAVYLTQQIAVYALSYFLPSIIGTYGELSSVQIGLLTSVPWIFAGLGAFLVPRLATDGLRSRRLVTTTMVGVCVGFALGAVSGPVVGLIGFCLGAFSFFAMQPIIFTFPASRLSGATLAGGIAFVNTIGLFGGFLGPYVMGAMEDLTGSELSGLWFVVGVCVVGTVLSLFLRHGDERP